ncbi:HNH endonuclease [Arenibacterium sp. CAU 1754]
MAHAVLIQNPESVFKDRPGIAYHFPKRYLKTLQKCVGDWVIFYESRTGAFGYTSVQRVQRIEPDPKLDDHFFAYLDRETEWSFERVVKRSSESGIAYEKSLRGKDGRPISGGASVSAVRLLSDGEFQTILKEGLRPLEGPNAIPRSEFEDSLAYGFAEQAVEFGPAELSEFRKDILTSRKARDASFARQVKAAYEGKCAISGLDLRNGGGRTEVQAAHILPVADGGPDTVRNGLALSGTLHWMFDRGLVAVAKDHKILVSHNKVSPDIVGRLIAPDMKLKLPREKRFHPHPEYLEWHRINKYGAVA